MFFMIVTLLGDVAYLAQILATLIYGGTLSPLSIGTISLLLSLWLAVDYKDNYWKK